MKYKGIQIKYKGIQIKYNGIRITYKGIRITYFKGIQNQIQENKNQIHGYTN